MCFQAVLDGLFVARIANRHFPSGVWIRKKCEKRIIIVRKDKVGTTYSTVTVTAIVAYMYALPVMVCSAVKGIAILAQPESTSSLRLRLRDGRARIRELAGRNSRIRGGARRASEGFRRGLAERRASFRRASFRRASDGRRGLAERRVSSVCA